MDVSTHNAMTGSHVNRRITPVFVRSLPPQECATLTNVRQELVSTVPSEPELDDLPDLRTACSGVASAHAIPLSIPATERTPSQLMADIRRDAESIAITMEEWKVMTDNHLLFADGVNLEAVRTTAGRMIDTMKCFQINTRDRVIAPLVVSTANAPRPP